MRDHIIDTVTIPIVTDEDVTITLTNDVYGLNNYFADTITYDTTNSNMDFNVISTYANNSQTATIGTDGTLKVPGDVEVDGVSLKKFMDTVSERLMILEPKPEMLEKYESLRNAYNEYKMLEKLCSGPDTDAN